MLSRVTVEVEDYQSVYDLDFETYRPGRKGLKAFKANGDLIPLHRTTNVMKLGAIPFTPTIQRLSEECGDYNYALIEWYDDRYRTMGYHSDCCFDSVDGSDISVLSLYPKKDIPPRTLMVKNKTTEEVTKIPMKHGHVIRMSYEFNRNHVHKIVGTSEWIGLTFAKSKTFIRFVDEIPYFENGMQLTVATKDETKEFRKIRNRENNFNLPERYPEVTYTISTGDIELRK